jgi:hypothetical protein
LDEQRVQFSDDTFQPGAAYASDIMGSWMKRFNPKKTQLTKDILLQSPWHGRLVWLTTNEANRNIKATKGPGYLDFLKTDLMGFVPKYTRYIF